MKTFRTAAVALAVAGIGLAAAPVSNAQAATTTLNGCATVSGKRVCLSTGVSALRLIARASITDQDGGVNYDVRVQNLRLQTHGANPTWVTQATNNDYDGWKPVSDSASVTHGGCGDAQVRAVVLLSWRTGGTVTARTFVTTAKHIQWCAG